MAIGWGWFWHFETGPVSLRKQLPIGIAIGRLTQA